MLSQPIRTSVYSRALLHLLLTSTDATICIVALIAGTSVDNFLKLTAENNYHLCRMIKKGNRVSVRSVASPKVKHMKNV